jgi:hypothetical protein
MKIRLVNLHIEKLTSSRQEVVVVQSLNGEWSPNDLVWDVWFEMTIAIETPNALFGHDCGFGLGIDMELLYSFTVRTLHRHYYIPIAKHLSASAQQHADIVYP